MIDWNTIILAVTIVFGMLSAFWLGSKVARNESVLPPLPGKLEIIEPKEPEDKYGEIWPKDKILEDEEQ